MHHSFLKLRDIEKFHMLKDIYARNTEKENRE